MLTEELLILIFNNEDMQFFFADGYTLTFRWKKQYYSYKFHQEKGVCRLPIPFFEEEFEEHHARFTLGMEMFRKYTLRHYDLYLPVTEPTVLPMLPKWKRGFKLQKGWKCRKEWEGRN